MKKFCWLLALFLLLSGCGKDTGQPQGTTPGKQTQLVRFDIYALGDLHGRLADTDNQCGVDELSTYLKQQPGNTVLLSTGDMWQGTSESNLTGGQIVTQWMNRMGFRAMTLGGHEFDWGEDAVQQNAHLAQFPFLGINVYSRQSGARADFCQSSLTVEAEGVQIGIIGAIGNCEPPKTGDIYFKTGEELTALVKAEAEKLRSQGADFIVYTLHDGSTVTTDGVNALPAEDRYWESYYDITLSDGYVDLVFEADSHYWYNFTDRHGVFHLQAGANNQGIAHATVLIDKTGRTPPFVTGQLVPASKYAHLEDDPVVAQLLEEYAQQIAPATKILGTNGQYRSSYDLCRLVAKLYCQAGEDLWGQAYDIVLGGGYISCRSPSYLPQGEVRYSQLQSLFPFDNTLTLCNIRGRDLTEKFLETDNPTYHISLTDFGESVRDCIDPEGTYYVVADSYTAQYAYNNMTVIHTWQEPVFARDLLAQHIAAGNLG